MTRKTLPVLFVMVSNHFPATYGHAFNWAVLAVLLLAGAGVRHYFNVRHRPGGARSGWLLLAGAAAVATEAMPLGNLTGMTAGERALLGRWIAQGARTE